MIEADILVEVIFLRNILEVLQDFRSAGVAVNER
jgi:hypothetical protein